MKEVDVVAIADIQIQWHLFTRVRWNILHQSPCANERDVGSSCCSNAKVIFELLMLALYEDSDCEQDDRGYQGTRGLCFFLGSLSLVRTTSQEWLGSRVIFDSEPHHWLWGTLLALHSDANESQNRRLDLGLAAWIIDPSQFQETWSSQRSQQQGFQIAFRFRD